jgi:hypothetical protein
MKRKKKEHESTSGSDVRTSSFRSLPFNLRSAQPIQFTHIVYMFYMSCVNQFIDHVEWIEGTCC